MPNRPKVFVLNLDSASLVSLVEALPAWEVAVLAGATAASLAPSWDPGAADLLVLQAGEDVAETLGLCRFLVFCSALSTDFRRKAAQTLRCHGSRQSRARADAPLLVLVPLGQKPLVKAALKAGAAECLVLPVQAEDVASAVTRALRFSEKRDIRRGMTIPLLSLSHSI